MKIKNTSLAAALSMLACVGAQASDGTVTVNGTVTNATCTTIIGNGTASSSFTVTLPTVNKNSLAVAGNTTGATAFTIGVSGCSGATAITPFFEAGTNVNASGRLTNTGTATNVEVQITTPAGAVVAIGSSAQLLTTTTLVGNAATVQYIARYYATGVAGAGSYASTFTYVISYT